MRTWAQFYRLTPSNSYTEPCGDRQLIFLDGRRTLSSLHEVARHECKKRGYDGYRLARGNSLLTPFYLTAAVIPSN